MNKARLQSWGNYPPLPQSALNCYWRSELPEKLACASQKHGTVLPYGSGLSYGDSCLAASDHVLRIRPLDRYISADWETGGLVAEAGMSLGDILTLAIPQGWFLPVTPGTQHVTLGGAIANDVHGKNHHRRGTFGGHVRSFGLLRSDRGHLVCSQEVESDLYGATIGGLGLTGIITWAQIQLMPIRSSQIDCLTQRFGELDEFFELSAELDDQHEFCVSWIDCSKSERTTGRGIYIAGDFAPGGSLVYKRSHKFTFPFTPSTSLVNSLSLQLFNSIYWHQAPRVRSKSQIGYNQFFYPLDMISRWNLIYGRKGFRQYQCVIPEPEARNGIRAILDAVAKSGSGSFLSVLKRFGNVPSPGLLSFPRPGITLAIDVAQTDSLGTRLLPRLDDIVRGIGGRLYPAKDSHMSAADFQRSYPEWRRLEELRDPVLLSHFWKRVTQ